MAAVLDRQSGLAGRKVLVVEDEYLIADDLVELLKKAGAEIVGPAASLPQAIRLLERPETIDAAVLDINLRGVSVFPLAEQLRGRDVPIMFLTGYGENGVPQEFADITRFEKPMGTTKVVGTLESLIAERAE